MRTPKKEKDSNLTKLEIWESAQSRTLAHGIPKNSKIPKFQSSKVSFQNSKFLP